MKKFTDKINESVEERIPTTEELFEKYSSLCQFEEGDSEYLIDKEDFKEAMIEFVKLHVEAALKKAVENMGKVRGEDDPFFKIDVRQILTAYPLNNIK